MFKKVHFKLALIIVVVLDLIGLLLVKPFVNQIYLDSDRNQFSMCLLFFYLILVIGFIGSLIYYYFKKNALKSAYMLKALVVFVVLLSFLHNTTTNLLLALNTVVSREKYTEAYLLKRNDEKMIFLLESNKKNLIYSKIELDKINSIREQNGRESVYRLKHLDTIHVNFAKGVFNVTFLDGRTPIN